MTNGDPEGRIFLSNPHSDNGIYFLLTTVFIYLFIFIYVFIYFFIYLFWNKLPEVPEHA